MGRVVEGGWVVVVAGVGRGWGGGEVVEPEEVVEEDKD